MKYDYRSGMDTKQCFQVHTQTWPYRPHVNEIFLTFAQSSRFHEIPSVTITNPGINTVEFENGVWLDDSREYVYAYNIEKHRAKRERRHSAKDSQYPNPYTTISEARWDVTIYRIPVKNIRSFHQHSSYFDMRFLSDGAIEYLKERARGFPERNSDGSFDSSKLQQIWRMLENARINRSNKSRNPYTSVVSIHISQYDGSFRLTNNAGRGFTDDELRGLFEIV